MKRLIVIVVTLAAALLVQLTIVNGLALPGGGAPDLVLLCVVVIGLTGGAQPGLIAGFCAGLALDLAPPGNELIGQYALVFCLVGYACGRMSFALRRSAVLAFATAAGAVLLGEVLAACLVLVLDTPQVTLATVAAELPSSVLYDLVLSPLALFVAVQVAVALGVSYDPLDDSPAFERGGSASQTGLADIAVLRRTRVAGASGDLAMGGGAWLTGDAAGTAAAVGEVGWLTGPATSRRARKEQARLTAALTGAAPRKGAIWVGHRPPGLEHGDSTAPAGPAGPSGLSRLRPEAGVAGSATRDGIPGPVRPAREPKIPFGTGSLAGTAPDGAGRLGRRSGTPKIAFGTGGLPGSGRATGRGVPKIAFGTGGLPGSGRATGRGVPKIKFGTGSLPGAGLGWRRRSPKIKFGTGLPRGPRLSPGRPAMPRFRSSKSAAGPWLAGSRSRSAGLGIGGLGVGGRGRPPRFGGRSAAYKATRSSWPRKARLRRRSRRWLPWARWTRGRQLGGDR